MTWERSAGNNEPSDVSVHGWHARHRASLVQRLGTTCLGLGLGVWVVGGFNKGILLVNPLKLKYDSYRVRIIWVKVTKTPSLPVGWVSLCEVSGFRVFA